jgi:hypothetical protein
MDLTPFASVDPTALRWLRTGDSPMEFELSAGDQRVARLAWNRPSGTLATLTTSGGTTTMKRVGFLHPRVTARAGNPPRDTARAGNPPRDTARVSVHLNYHRIEFPGGASFRFHRAGLLLPAWQVTTDAGEELLHLEPVRDGRKLVGGAVVASAAGAHRPELSLLIGLAWYVIVLSWFEDEALVPLEGPDAPAGSAPRAA